MAATRCLLSLSSTTNSSLYITTTTKHSSVTKRTQLWPYQSGERRGVAGGGVRAGRVAAQPEVRARGGVLEAGEHPPVHDEEEGHEGAPRQQPARAPPPPPVLLLLPPPRPLQQRGGRRGARRRQQRQRRGRRRLGHPGALDFGSRRAGSGGSGVGIEQTSRRGKRSGSSDPGCDRRGISLSRECD